MKNLSQLGLKLLNPIIFSCVIFLGGCATIQPFTPSKDQKFFDIPLTQKPPDEKQLPPINTENLTADEINTINIFRQSVRGVVNITSYTIYQNSFLGRFPVGGSGSGLIIDKQGHVITNYHVVHNAKNLIVTMYDSSNYPATLVGYDAQTDLAVLKFDPKGRSLNNFEFNQSNELHIGQKVLALGNPFSLESTLTTGVISGLNRPLQTKNGFIIQDLIQTDASVNPGNSGGPLLNSDGKVIGVNTMIISPSGGSVGINFAVPAKTVERISRELIKDGLVSRGWIEIQGKALTPAIARQAGIKVSTGIIVTKIIEGGNAYKAGLRVDTLEPVLFFGLLGNPYEHIDGDIILALNDQQVYSMPHLLSLIEASKPGEKVKLTIFRNNEEIDVDIVLSPQPR